MRNTEIIWVDDLIKAIRKKWNEEHPADYDPGNTTYANMIRFIEEFSEQNGIIGNKGAKGEKQ